MAHGFLRFTYTYGAFPPDLSESDTIEVDDNRGRTGFPDAPDFFIDIAIPE